MHDFFVRSVILTVIQTIGVILLIRLKRLEVLGLSVSNAVGDRVIDFS